jgi:hypothetical protein
METLHFLLPQTENEGVVEVGRKVVCDLVDPYLIAISSNCYFSATTNRLKLVAHIQALGSVCGTLLQNSAARISLGGDVIEVFVKLFSKFCNQRSCEVPEEMNAGCALNPATVIGVLDHMLLTANPDEIESSDFPLSSLFDSVLQLLQHSDLSICYLLTSSILPLFITHSHLDRVQRVWDFVVEVHCQKLCTSSQSSDLVLTILCCFTNFFISCSHASPFSCLLSNFLSARLTPVYDLRTEPLFWSIILEGLASHDPISRKRCMYLVQCVLMSVKRGGVGGEEELVADGGVFWWRIESGKELSLAWDSLILILETMEEKQVRIIW